MLASLEMFLFLFVYIMKLQTYSCTEKEEGTLGCTWKLYTQSIDSSMVYLRDGSTLMWRHCVYYSHKGLLWTFHKGYCDDFTKRSLWTPMMMIDGFNVYTQTIMTSHCTKCTGVHMYSGEMYNCTDGNKVL